jgi:hypothetical protein
MEYWEILATIRGYGRREMFSHQTTWSASRWNTFCILKAIGVRGLSRPSDLVEFPWEKSHDDELTDEEVARIREEIEQANALVG